MVDDEVGYQLDEEKPLRRLKWVAVDGKEGGLIKEQVRLRRGGVG